MKATSRTRASCGHAPRLPRTYRLIQRWVLEQLSGLAIHSSSIRPLTKRCGARTSKTTSRSFPVDTTSSSEANGFTRSTIKSFAASSKGVISSTASLVSCALPLHRQPTLADPELEIVSPAQARSRAGLRLLLHLVKPVRREAVSADRCSCFFRARDEPAPQPMRLALPKLRMKTMHCSARTAGRLDLTSL